MPFHSNLGYIIKRYLVATGCRWSSMAGGRGRGGRGGDSFRDMGVGSAQPVGEAMVHVLRLGRRIEVLHGAEIFGRDRLEGGRPETSLERRAGKVQGTFKGCRDRRK